MKRLLLASLILLTCACTRISRASQEAPKPTESFLLTFKMPEECLSTAKYKNRQVFLTGTASYEYRTDVAGMLTVDGIIPGIYDIITNWEMSGAEFKKLVKDPAGIDDKARVIVGVSLMNQRLFQPQDMVIDLSAAIVRGLMISKIYYAGTKDDSARDYIADSYVEIFNNSDEVLYLDGKYLALTESVSPAAYPANENPEYIYMRQICRFPGAGTQTAVQPGGSIVVAARSARDHRESAATSVDLSHADFEVKTMEGSGNPDVPMLPIVHNSTKVAYLNLLSGGPNGVVLFEATQEEYDAWPEVYQIGKTSGELFKRVPKGAVIDGVECLKKPAQTAPDVNTKRLQQDVDAGFITITAVNGKNHESVERKVSRTQDGRCYLTDTNNSTADFVVLTDPTPQKYDKEGLL